VTSEPFPAGDEALSRTLVYDYPGDYPVERATSQILVTIYATGEVEVAERPRPASSWGVPWTLREEETW